jgi:hypothetical protein
LSMALPEAGKLEASTSHAVKLPAAMFASRLNFTGRHIIKTLRAWGIPARLVHLSLSDLLRVAFDLYQ